MTMSPARSTAPPMSAASVAHCRRTERSQPPLEGGRELAALGVVERGSGGHRHVDDALGLALELIEPGGDLRQQ